MAAMEVATRGFVHNMLHADGQKRQCISAQDQSDSGYGDSPDDRPRDANDANHIGSQAQSDSGYGDSGNGDSSNDGAEIGDSGNDRLHIVTASLKETTIAQQPLPASAPAPQNVPAPTSQPPSHQQPITSQPRSISLDRTRLRQFYKTTDIRTSRRADDVIEQMSGLLAEYVGKHIQPIPSMAIRPIYLGTTEYDAKLCLVIFCNDRRKVHARIKRFLEKRRAIDLYRPRDPMLPSFDVHVGPPPRPTARLGVEIPIGDYWDQEYASTVCGLPIRFTEEGRVHHSLATLGGLLQLRLPDGTEQLFGLTTAHGAIDWSDTEECDRSDSDESIDSDVSSSTSVTRSDIEALASVELIIEGKSDPSSCLISVHQSSDQTLKEPIAFSALESIEEGCFRDWALFRFPSELQPRPNMLKLDGRSPRSLKVPNTATNSNRHRQVYVLTGDGKPRLGSLSSSTGRVLLTPGTKFVRAWILEMQDNLGIAPGGSGAWVVDMETLEVFGHVAANDAFMGIYVIPLTDIFQEIERRIPGVSIAFPTAPTDSLTPWTTPPEASGADTPLSKLQEHTSSAGQLLSACSRGDRTNLVHLLTSGNQFPESELSAALMEAVRGERSDCAEVLIGYGAPLNTVDEHRFTPLALAASLGNLAFVSRLLELGAYPDMNQGKDGGHNALMIACSKGYWDIAKLLLSSGAGVNAQFGSSGTPLIAAARGGHYAAMTVLLEAEADVNINSGDYGTALIAASFHGHVDIVRLLLDSGADVSQSGRYGTALQAVVMGADSLRAEHAESVYPETRASSYLLDPEKLLGFRVNVDESESQSTHAVPVASRKNSRHEIVQSLLRAGATNTESGLLVIFLQLAVRKGLTDVINLICEIFDDMGVEYQNQETALLAASIGSQFKFTGMYVDLGGHDEFARQAFETRAGVKAEDGDREPATLAAETPSTLPGQKSQDSERNLTTIPTHSRGSLDSKMWPYAPLPHDDSDVIVKGAWGEHGDQDSLSDALNPKPEKTHDEQDQLEREHGQRKIQPQTITEEIDQLKIELAQVQEDREMLKQRLQKSIQSNQDLQIRHEELYAAYDNLAHDTQAYDSALGSSSSKTSAGDYPETSRSKREALARNRERREAKERSEQKAEKERLSRRFEEPNRARKVRRDNFVEGWGPGGRSASASRQSYIDPGSGLTSAQKQPVSSVAPRSRIPVYAAPRTPNPISVHMGTNETSAGSSVTYYDDEANEDGNYNPYPIVR